MDKWARLRNRIDRVKAKVLGLERPLGVKPELVYAECPAESATRSSLDLEFGRGPKVTQPGGKPCRAAAPAPSDLDDPLGFLVRSAKEQDAAQTAWMSADLASTGCQSFKDKASCGLGKIQPSTLKPKCQWANDKCT